jgi:transposase InsO family protein
VRQRKRKWKRLGESTVPAKRLRAERPNHAWALDFQFDTTSDGHTLKLLHVVDEYTREALAMRVARSIDADHTTRVLDQMGARHPAHCSTSQRLKELLGQRSRQCGRPRPRRNIVAGRALHDRLVLAGSAVDLGRPPCDCRRHCGDERTSASNR